MAISQLEKKKDEVMEWTRKAMPRHTHDGHLDNAALFEKAQVRYPFLSRLDLRQFYARFPLQIMKQAKGGAAKGGRRSAEARKQASTGRSGAEASRAAGGENPRQNGNGGYHQVPGTDLIVNLIRECRKPDADVVTLVAAAPELAQKIRTAN